MMSTKLLGAALVLALVLAAMPNVSAGDITFSDVTYTPDRPQQGDTIHVKAKIIATLNLTWVKAFPCWEKPTYTCGMPQDLQDNNKDNIWEVDLSNTVWTNGNVVHINITAKDSANAEKLYAIPPFTIGAGTGGPEDYLTESDCKAHSYFWWDDACHAQAKQVSDYKDEGNCTSAGFYWYDSKCNAQKGTPDKYTDKTKCTSMGYFWYDDKCNAEKKKTNGGNGFLPAFETILVFSAMAVAGLVLLSRKRRSI